MKPKSEAARLEDLPNIGRTAAGWLRKAGIATPDQLYEVGSVEAVLRIMDIRTGDPPCRSMLCAMEGAIRGIRWHSIPAPERDRLWATYRSRRDATGVSR